MRLIILFFVVLTSSFGQDIVKQKFTAHNKGKFYFFWGGNRDKYAKSDISFKGKDYDFTLLDVASKDKPKGWHIDFINPTRMTVPQTNFRMGYFINDHYNISIGVEHMKYVVKQNQAVSYTGYYPNQNTNFYGETLPNNQVFINPKFLALEHTDGLNLVNTEISRVDDLSRFIGIQNTDKIQLNITEGVGVGFMYPRTDASVLGKQRHNEYHVSGFGISVKAGLNVTVFKYFFIQTEIKGGYINLNNIKTTFDSADSAQQKILFVEHIIAFGGIFKL